MICARLIALLAVLAAAGPAFGQAEVDPQHKYAWGENIGWTNWRDAADGSEGVGVEATYLFGYVWAENVGWINVGDGSPDDGLRYANQDGQDFGVNIGPTGDLSGYAWGENIGWVNFDTTAAGEQRARFDACAHRFYGFAWGENVGWINLGATEHYLAVGPCDFGDRDCDGAVDLDDYIHLADLLGGPGISVDCAAFDADADGDIDLEDFAVFQGAFGEVGGE